MKADKAPNLYRQANMLCNNLDHATKRTREQTNPCNHGVNVALGKLGEAFLLMNEVRTLVGDAEKHLDEWVDFNFRRAQ